ncbi:MAG: CPBP family intramembrane metalloprotease [Actinobacteria bacterium]|nr:CPBP family intramembrane metalloprotease [Actinomycetota bacterium]
MSALDPGADRSGRPLLAFVVVAAGTVALISRPFVDAGPNARIGLLAAAYVAIGLACIAVPVERGRARLPAAVVVTMGLSAVATVALSAGPDVPVTWGSAALPLSLLAAVSEEALFRRVAYAKLERFGPAAAIVGTAALFALVHLPAYGVAALPVDLCAGVLFGWQRWASGHWTAPAATHAAANLWVVLG